MKLKNTKLRSFLASLAVLLAVLAVGAGLVGIKLWQFNQMGTGGQPPEQPTFVSLSDAQPVTIRQHSSAIGTIVAAQSITLSNEIAGKVTNVNITPGSVVEAGAVLLQLDTSLESAQLDAAMAAAKMAESRMNRTRDAFRTGALTPLEMDEAETQLTQARARLAELQAMINKKALIAPFRARVGLSDTHVGQYLPSGTVITSLQSVDDHLFVDFALPQSVARSIEIEQPVTLISSTPFSGQTNYTAKVSAMDSRTDKLTRNVMVRSRLDNAPDFFKPGDSVKVSIDYGPQVEAVSIPAEAVRRTPSGSQVFVAIEDQEGKLRASQRAVQVIQSMGERVAIYTGVKVGQRVVTSGSFKLMDGNLIAEDEETTPAMATADPGATDTVSQP